MPVQNVGMAGSCSRVCFMHRRLQPGLCLAAYKLALRAYCIVPGCEEILFVDHVEIYSCNVLPGPFPRSEPGDGGKLLSCLLYAQAIATRAMLGSV
jgi:hypothetical protein